MKNALASLVLACSLSVGLLACETEEALVEAGDPEQSERYGCWRQYAECLHWASSAEDEYWCDVAYAECAGY
jgi:hypothetical protein